MVTCSACGAQNSPGKHFCTSCGAALPAPNQGTDISKSYDPSLFGKLGKDMFSGFNKASDTQAKPDGEAAAQPPRAKAEPASTESPRTQAPASKAEALRAVAKAGSKAIIKSVSLSILVLGPGFLMLMAGMLIPGMIWLFFGSFGLMAWTYRKPWRLGAVSCLMPPAAAAICYVVQLFLFGSASPPALLLAGAIGAGIAVGYWRARTHEVKKGDDGGIVAERTIQYLIVWVAAYGITQFLAMTAAGTFEVRAGLITGAFTTAMLAMVSVMIWRQFRRISTSATGTAVGLFIGIAVFASLPASPAYANPEAKLRYIFGDQGFPSSILDAFPAGWRKANNAISFTSSPQTNSAYFQSYFHGPGPSLVLNLRLYETPAGRDSEEYFFSGGRNAHLATMTDHLHCSGARARFRTGYSESRFQGDRLIVPAGGGAHALAFTPQHVIHIILRQHGRKQDVLPERYWHSIAQTVCDVVKQNLPDHGIASSARPNNNDTSQPGRTDTGREPSPGDRPGGPTGNSPALDETEVAAATAAIAAALIAAGIAVNVAQAVAAAIAQALQAGVQLTSEEIQAAITDALLNRSTGSQPEPESNAPPNVRSTERVRPPTPVLDENGNPFETNEDGEYLVPTKRGDEWVSKAEAERAAADLRAEKARREAEQAAHRRQTERDLGRSRQKMREEDHRARAEEQRQRDISEWWHKDEKGAHGEGSYEDFDKKRREHEERLEAARRDAEAGISPDQRHRLNQLETAIGNAIGTLPDGEDRAQLKSELSGYIGDDDRHNLEQMWQRLRGLRQNQLVDDATEARRLGEESDKAELQESAITFVRDGAKAGLQAGISAATGGGGSFLHATGAVLIGGAGLTTMGGVEGGYVAENGDITYDPKKATKGAIRGGFDTLTSAVGGVKAGGSRLIMGGKAAVSGVATGARVTSDTFDKTGDWDKARKQGLKAGAAEFGKSVGGEWFDEKARQAKEGGTFTSADGKEKWQSLDDRFVAARDAAQARANAGKTANDLIGNTVVNLASDDEKTVGEAAREAVVSEITGKVAGKVIETAKIPPGNAAARQQVIDRLNAERRGTAAQPEITPDYESYLRRQGRDRSDLMETGEALPDDGGFTSAARRHAQKVADSRGVKIAARTVETEGSEAIEAGDAVPKRESMKANSGKPIDELLGMNPAHRNRVVVFDSKLPDRDSLRNPDGTPFSDEQWRSLQNRHKLRTDQYNQYRDKLVDNDEYEMDGQLVLDKLQGKKPIGPDMDLLVVTGLYGEPLPRAVTQQTVNDLIDDPSGGINKGEGSSVKHPEHAAWDIASLDDTKIGDDGLTDRERALQNDRRIIERIRPGGEAVAVFTGRPGMTDARPTGAHYTGTGAIKD